MCVILPIIILLSTKNYEYYLEHDLDHKLDHDLTFN